MIVLGTHGKGMLRQAFLGSVARSVMERTKKPTFLVRCHPKRQMTGVRFKTIDLGKRRAASAFGMMTLE